MYKFILFLGICLAFASGSKPPEKSPAKHPARLPVADNKCQKIVGCYYINNENEQVDPTLNIEMIDVHICTHLFYSSVSLKKNASIELDDAYTDEGEGGGYERISKLSKRNKRFKTLTTIVEYGILFDPKMRGKLVDNIVAFLQKYKLNGIELKSQYLAENNAVASDKQNFVLLLKALKENFDKHGLILALSVDGYESTANKYDIKEISKYVSFIILKAFDFHGNPDVTAKRPKAGHIAPLYHSSKENAEERKLNVDYIVKYWITKGAPPNKLILGTTFSGIDYTLVNPKIVGRDAPVVVDPKYSIPPTSYYYTCPWEKNRVWTTLWDKEQQVPYISKRKEMIAYENVASIKLKAEYAKRMQLGGVFADSIEEDDFSGHCGGEKFTLLKTMSRVLRDKC
ncbi:acidic mammalian chitinase-like [Belonocnema kinseyi]|uniref:acidic mammalian chitinase-like n=1 Tax=Belonocnema kinseyi TaxID=2817044 RepID=UPI00143D9B63|nr:acidic mammalian chitinase-like [Belonocnema kinseyi]